MKNIEEYFEYLYSLERSGMKYSLDNISRLLNALGNPHKHLRFIHIAGTNGKGATASFAASLLMECGLRTGLFTSPHILKFNERIRVDGKCISDRYIKAFLESNLRLIRKVKPSFFEVNTALAFKYFHDRKVDAAVVEAGLGGRLDSTNIIQPDVSIITPIGMDHMQYLGNTLQKIAKEKLGIVKPGVDVIVSDNNRQLKVLFAKAIKKEHLLRIEKYAQIEDVKRSANKLSFRLTIENSRGIRLVTPLSGNYQSRNAAAGFLAASKFLGFVPTSDIIKKAALDVKKNTGYFGRMESLTHKDRRFVLDVSHNPAGVMTTLNELSNHKIGTVIFGMMSDKDYKSAVDLLLRKSVHLIFTQPDYKRALNPEILLKYAARSIKRKNNFIKSASSVRDAVELSLKTNPEGEEILIIGSFFLVSDALKAMGYKSLPV